MEVKEFISEKDIAAKVDTLATRIATETNDIAILTVLDGAKVFSDALQDKLRNKGCSVSNYDIKVKSYQGTETSGKISVVQDCDDLSGKDIYIVDDILDTGTTMQFLKDYITSKKHARSARIVVLLDKPSRRVKTIEADFVGFEIEDKFVVGYGIDYNEHYRELPFIGFVEQP